LTAAAAVPAPEPVDERTPSSLTGHAVLIGYGRVGTVVAEGLERQGTPFVVIEDGEKRVAAAHADGIEVVVGNAASGKSLALANVAAAKTLLIAIPNAFEAGQAVEQARKLNPNLQIIARAHSDEEVSYLHDLGANEVIMGEREIGLGMVGWSNTETAPEADAAPTPAGLDAVAAALKLDLDTPVPANAEPIAPVVVALEPVPPEPEPAAPAEVLEAAIEAAHPEHEITGPAEPLEAVPALGEMPVEPDRPEPVAAPPEPVTETPPPRAKPTAPASTPGTAFNPEVVPAEE
jgi:CPA2 family monovalent cation:H+ antiporter-2